MKQPLESGPGAWLLSKFKSRCFIKPQILILTTALGSKNFCLHSSQGSSPYLLGLKDSSDTASRGEDRREASVAHCLPTDTPTVQPGSGAGDRHRMSRAGGRRAGPPASPGEPGRGAGTRSRQMLKPLCSVRRPPPRARCLVCKCVRAGSTSCVLCWWPADGTSRRARPFPSVPRDPRPSLLSPRLGALTQHTLHLAGNPGHVPAPSLSLHKQRRGLAPK